MRNERVSISCFLFRQSALRRYVSGDKAYLEERLPRFDSSNMHSWLPVEQRLQGGPCSAPTHFILRRRHTVHALAGRSSVERVYILTMRTWNPWLVSLYHPLLSQPRDYRREIHHHHPCVASSWCHPKARTKAFFHYYWMSTYDRGEFRPSRNPGRTGRTCSTAGIGGEEEAYSVGGDVVAAAAAADKGSMRDMNPERDRGALAETVLEVA